MDQPAQDPPLEARVGRLEVDMHDVKSTLGRLEPLIVSIHHVRCRNPFRRVMLQSERDMICAIVSLAEDAWDADCSKNTRHKNRFEQSLDVR